MYSKHSCIPNPKVKAICAHSGQMANLQRFCFIPGFPAHGDRSEGFADFFLSLSIRSQALPVHADANQPAASIDQATHASAASLANSK